MPYRRDFPVTTRILSVQACPRARTCTDCLAHRFKVLIKTCPHELPARQRQAHTLRCSNKQIPKRRCSKGFVGGIRLGSQCLTFTRHIHNHDKVDLFSRVNNVMVYDVYCMLRVVCSVQKTACDFSSPSAVLQLDEARQVSQLGPAVQGGQGQGRSVTSVTRSRANCVRFSLAEILMLGDGAIPPAAALPASTRISAG